MLFAAARDDHVRCTIEPALDAGKWVVCDRFADSTRVYQGVLGQVDQRFIKALERVSVGDLTPDLTFVLDVPVDVGLKRAAGGAAATPSPIASKPRNSTFTKSCARPISRSPQTEPHRCVVIDASAPKKTVAKRIWAGGRTPGSSRRAGAAAPRIWPREHAAS